MDINTEIKTTLHYKDVALIAVALGMYQDNFKHAADKEVLSRARNLVNRLGAEMADCKPSELY